MIFVESTESFLVSSPGAALNSSLHPSLSSSLFFVSSILFTILCFHLLLLVNCAVKLQLSLTRGRGRMQVYLLLTSPLPLLHLILLLPLSLAPSLPRLLLVCPPSLLLKIDTPSISSAPALSLADCFDGARKTDAEEIGKRKETQTQM